MKVGESSIKILSELVDILDKNEVKYNICYNQKTSRRIKIIVEDTTDFDMIKLLLDSTLFRVVEGKFLRIVYKEVEFTFIKVNVNDFNIATFYYSWDYLRLLLINTFKNLNITFKETGLYYNYGKEIFLTNSIKHILDFLDLNDDIYRKGFKSHMDEIQYIMTSFYFNPKIFEIDVEENDFFANDKRELKEFITKENETIEAYMPFAFHEYFDNIEAYWDTIDIYFNGFMRIVYEIKAKKFLKEKKKTDQRDLSIKPPNSSKVL
jgi:hypothetical protein